MTEQVGDDFRSHVTGAKVGGMTAPLKPHELATMARIRNKDNQLAERLRSHGWRCVPPEQVEQEEELTT